MQVHDTPLLINEKGVPVTVAVSAAGPGITYGPSRATVTDASAAPGSTFTISTPTWVVSAGGRDQSADIVVLDTSLPVGSGTVVATPTGTATTDTAALQAAIDAASALGDTVHLRAGTYVVTGLTIKPNVTLEGAGRGATVIKLANGANADVIQGVNFPILTGTGTVGTGTGAYQWAVRKLSIDGNRANQTGASFGIRVYGYDFDIADVSIRNCFTDGLWTEFGPLSSENPDSMEARYSRLKIHDNGGWGWHNRGPQDSMASDLTIYANNQSGGTAGGLWVEDDNATNHFLAGALQLANSHIWDAKHNWGILNDSALYAVNVEVEGATFGQILNRGTLIWRGGKVFVLGSAATTLAAVGLQLGDDGATPGVPSSFAYTSANNDIDMRMSGLFGSSRDSAPINWIACNNSSLRAHVALRTAPVAKAINAGAVGTQISALATLQIADVTSLPAKGQVTVPTSGGTATLAYTGTSGGNTLTGISVVTGTGTWTVSAGSATLVVNTIWGAVDNQSRVQVQGTNTAATAPQRAGWSTYFEAGPFRRDIGVGGTAFTLTNNGADYLNINSSAAQPRLEHPSGVLDRWYRTGYSDSMVEVDGAKGHIRTPTTTTVPTVAAGAANGGSPPAPTVAGATDTRGQASLGSGTAPTAGGQVTVTLANAHPTRNPVVVVSAANAATAALQPYATATGLGTFIIGFGVAPAASQAAGTYLVDYVVIG